MIRTTTRRPGRLRALAVVGALAISLIAGAAAPAFADEDGKTTGLDRADDARHNGNAPWTRVVEGDDVVTPQGWSWF